MGEREGRTAGSAGLWASVLGAGYAPVAPGTVGSAVGTVLFLVIAGPGLLPTSAVWAFCLAMVFLASAVTLGDGDRLRRYRDEEDPQVIVSDELAGVFMTYFLLVPPFLPPHNALALALLGFIAFRIMDVAKPFGIRRLESLPAGWGILADDLLAGVYAAGLLHVLLRTLY